VTKKRTAKTAAPAPKPITAQEALEAGRKAYEEIVRSTETAAPLHEWKLPR
jgi:hypothetical protein